MVLLTMTPAVAAAVKQHRSMVRSLQGAALPPGPSLDEPAPGQPISHDQIIAISGALSAEWLSQADHASRECPYSLDVLLRGVGVFLPAKSPKPEPTKEYKELMARLRREEESRAYERMISQPALSPDGDVRTSLKELTHFNKSEYDEMTYSDVNRQLTLIMNILVTMVACGIAIWLVASHWSAPKRLALSMGASAVLGVAEVVIYSGYIRRLTEARDKERKLPERKSISTSWIIQGGKNSSSELSDGSSAVANHSNDTVRRRKKG